jgi:hypothetical protein
MYRIEVWINNNYKTEENLREYPLKTLTEYLEKNFGSTVEDKPINA